MGLEDTVGRPLDQPGQGIALGSSAVNRIARLQPVNVVCRCGAAECGPGVDGSEGDVRRQLGLPAAEVLSLRSHATDVYLLPDQRTVGFSVPERERRQPGNQPCRRG